RSSSPIRSAGRGGPSGSPSERGRHPRTARARRPPRPARPAKSSARPDYGRALARTPAPPHTSRQPLVTAAARLLDGLLALRVAVRREHGVEAGAAACRAVRLHALLVEQVVERVALARSLRDLLLLLLGRRGWLLDVLGRDRGRRRLRDRPLHFDGSLLLALLFLANALLAGRGHLLLIEALFRADDPVLPFELLVDRSWDRGVSVLLAAAGESGGACAGEEQGRDRGRQGEMPHGGPP